MSLTYQNSDVNIARVKFDSLSHDVLTTSNEGDLVPFTCQEILPGDTFSIDTGVFSRLQTMIAPVFGDAFLDIFYFFVPNRLVWNHWKEFCGENNTSHWTQPTEYTIPQVSAPSGGWQKGTIAQAFGIRINTPNISVNALPFRAYSLIYNDWFRSENLQDPTYFDIDDTNITGSNGNNILTDLVKGGKYAKVGKLRDLFVSALPAPQKGNDVVVPLGNIAPVKFSSTLSNYIGNPNVSSTAALRYAFSNTASGADQKWTGLDQYRVAVTTVGGSATAPNAVFSATVPTSLQPTPYQTTIDNAYADLSSATASTINQLRLAFQTQRLLERDARGGTRYQELIWSHFNVLCPDFRVQRSEYLGGSRHRLDFSSVVQTSESQSTPQGTITGISATSHYNSDFTKSFTEHGLLIGLYTIRVKHQYSQGIPKLFNKKTRYDFYYPVLANIGEVGIKNSEIFVQGTSVDDQIFGYMEAWYEYRYGIDRVSGEFSPDYSQSLQSWTFADDFSTLPILGSAFMQEGVENIDRVIAVQSSNSDQFKVSLSLNISAVRPMPLHSVPGLIDHN